MAKKGGYRVGAGRKKGFSAIEAEKAREYIAHKVSDNLETIVNKALEQAFDGDNNARNWLTERAYGKVKTSTEVEVKELPIPILGGIFEEGIFKIEVERP
jgi:hypothetical protein